MPSGSLAGWSEGAVHVLIVQRLQTVQTVIGFGVHPLPDNEDNCTRLLFSGLQRPSLAFRQDLAPEGYREVSSSVQPFPQHCAYCVVRGVCTQDKHSIRPSEERAHCSKHRLLHPVKSTIGRLIQDQILPLPLPGLLSVTLKHGRHEGCIHGMHLHTPWVLVAERRIFQTLSWAFLRAQLLLPFHP